jgi:hypothetical protein
LAAIGDHAATGADAVDVDELATVGSSPPRGSQGDPRSRSPQLAYACIAAC